MDGIWTVTELCQFIKGVLDDQELLHTCTVKGELSNVSLYPSGHLYLTLKDASSQIAGVMFAGEARKLKFKPEEGMKVLGVGRVSIFAPRSQYQIILQELQPEGIGELFIAFQQLKEKLEKEGLFNPARKRPIPFFPRVVGIVTSLQGAAIHDMLSIVERRNPAIRVIVAQSLVQGPEAAQSLMAGLSRLGELPEVEVIVLARGGGSPEELWAFNDEKLAREIFQSKVPVISAVGHETDFTIADFVADLRAPTPSAAAELLAPHREALFDQLLHLYERLRLSLSNRLQQEERFLQALLNRPVFRFPLERIQRESQSLDQLVRKLDERFVNLLKFRNVEVANLGQKLEALSPLGILKRGYTLVTKKEKLIKSAEEARTAGNVTMIFHDGKVDAAIPRQALKTKTPKPMQESFLDL